jgi:hypothetical protein
MGTNQPSSSPMRDSSAPAELIRSSSKTRTNLGSQQVAAGGERRISFYLPIQNAVGKHYVARSFLREAWDKDEMRLYVTQISTTQEN